MKRLTLYSRPDCHLCDELLNGLEILIAGRATVEIVDISGDDDLEVKYGLKIPVLEADGVELCCYQLDTGRVVDYLASA